MKIAGFEKRIFSYLIDLIIPIALSVLLYFIVFRYSPIKTMFTIYVILLTLISITYFIINTIVTYLSNGYTLGNLFFHIRVIGENEKLSFISCVLKYAFLAFPMCAVINAFYMIITHTEITIFDKISLTKTYSTRID